MANQTVFYHSGMLGAPASSLRGSAGLLTSVFDAVLVNGFNVTAITGVTRSGSTATFQLSGANNFSALDVVEVAGWDQAAYNGRFRVVSRTSNTVSVQVSGSPATPGTGVGTTMRHPPAGWNRLAFGANRVGYQTGAGSQGHWLQVENDDPYADGNQTVRTRMAIGLSGLNLASSLEGQRQVLLQTGGWIIVADARTCYVVSGEAHVLFFGEFESFVPADAFPFFQTRGETGEGSSMSGRLAVSGRYFPQWIRTPGISDAYTTPGLSLLRGSSQTGGAVEAHCLETADLPYTNANANMKRWQQLSNPNPSDGSLPLLPFHLVEYTGSAALRGTLRGMYWPLVQQPSGSFVNGFVRLDDAIVSGQVRSSVQLKFGINGESQLAFDLGDWA